MPGHHLRSNQYLVVRVYNGDEATKNAVPFGAKEGTKFSNGQLVVIKGTEVPFFIPPTGFEVLTEDGKYVREALTLERLEYCILLDEDGEKRFERGPKVVFPEATEKFQTKKDNAEGASSRKFKAIELNDQMGLYIKVIADYIDEVFDENITSNVRKDLPNDTNVVVIKGRTYFRQEGKVFAEYKTGEELFITGKEQRIYYPRPEHALIEYKDPAANFPRQRYYGIAIPTGEGRYILEKNEGDVQTVEGPADFPPGPPPSGHHPSRVGRQDRRPVVPRQRRGSRVQREHPLAGGGVR